MRYWLDTEFIEDGETIDLISIAIVAEDGRKLYCEVANIYWSKASQWVLDNVKPHLWGNEPDGLSFHKWSITGGVGRRADKEEIAELIKKFCDPETYGTPEFWGYYADCDWVVLCQLFGTMMDLPKGWPMFCMDIKQEQARLGVELPEQGADEHHALADARWNKKAWEFLKEEEERKCKEQSTATST